MVGNDNESVEDLRSRVLKLERKNRPRVIAPLLGASAGIGVGHYFLSDDVREMADALEEGVHALKVVSTLGRFGYGNEAIFQKTLGQVDPNLRQEYEENVSNERLIIDGSREAIEAMQRSSSAFPGQNSIPVRELKGWKGKILEATKGLVSGEKEDVKKTNTDQYQVNYNDLARIRLSAIERREVSGSEARTLASKLEESTLNTGRIDQMGLETFSGLIGDYNNASRVLGDIKGLSVGEIYRGEEDANFTATVQQAREYNIKPFVPGAWADASIYGLWALGAYAGLRAGKSISKIASPVYTFGRKGAGLTAKASKTLLSAFKSLSKNRDQKK